MSLTNITTQELDQLVPRHAYPDAIERGRKQDISLPIYKDADLVVPVGGTVEIVSNSQGGLDDPLIPAKNISVVNDIAQVTLAAADTADLDLSDDWLEIWELQFTVDNETITVSFRREASLCRVRLYPTITDIDILNRHTELRKFSERAKDRRSYQNHREEAWDYIMVKLIELGNRPNLIISAYALRPAHLALSLHYVMVDRASSAGGSVEGKYWELADRYWKQFEKEFKSVNYKYDATNSGTADDDEKRTAAQPVMWLNAPASWSGYIGGCNNV